MMLLTLLMLTLIMMLPLMKHPLSIGFLLILQTLMIAFITGIINNNMFMLSYILFITMMSGAYNQSENQLLSKSYVWTSHNIAHHNNELLNYLTNKP